MKATDIIKELKKRIELYGDLDVVIRLNDETIDEYDCDILAIFGDDTINKIVIK